jgi:hypothetical protein
VSLLQRWRKSDLILPGNRGFEVPGGGGWKYMPDPPWFRAPSSDLAGFTPWVRGGGTSPYGIPLGPIKDSVGILQCDPKSWFERAKLISSASAYVLGLNGLGKSTLLRHWVIGLNGYGTPSLVLADLKGEYVATITALGGQVLRMGRGQDRLNILDITEAVDAAKHLPKLAADKLLASARARRQAAVESLFAIEWGHAPTSAECSVLRALIRVMDLTVKGEGVLADLLRILQAAPESVRDAALDRGDMAAYLRITENLERTLKDWVNGGGLGEIFSGKTTARLIRGRSAVIDVSEIDEDDVKLRAAVMVASWSAGFGLIAIGHALADAGLEEYEPVAILQDELQLALQLPGVASRYNTLTRLDRFKGVVRIMCSHSAGDPRTIADPADRAMAEGFFARSGVKILFGLEEAEMDLIQPVMRLTDAECDYLTGLTTPPGYDTDGTKGHPGRGFALAKAGNRPGIPFELKVPKCVLDLKLHDTNQHWKMAS